MVKRIKRYLLHLAWNYTPSTRIVLDKEAVNYASHLEQYYSIEEQLKIIKKIQEAIKNKNDLKLTEVKNTLIELEQRDAFLKSQISPK